MKKVKLISGLSTVGVLGGGVVTSAVGCSSNSGLSLTATLNGQILLNNEDVGVQEGDVISFNASGKTIDSISVSPTLSGITTSDNLVKFNNVDSLPQNSGDKTYTFVITSGNLVG